MVIFTCHIGRLKIHKLFYIHKIYIYILDLNEQLMIIIFLIFSNIKENVLQHNTIKQTKSYQQATNQKHILNLLTNLENSNLVRTHFCLLEVEFSIVRFPR